MTALQYIDLIGNMLTGEDMVNQNLDDIYPYYMDWIEPHASGKS